MRNISAFVLIKGVRKAHIYGDKFEEAILCHYRDYHLVAGFRVVIKEGETPRVSLDEKVGGLVERLVW